MRVIRIRNNTNVEQLWIKSFTANEEFEIPNDNPAVIVKYATNNDLLSAISNGNASIGNSTEYLVTINDQISWIRGEYSQIEAQITSQPDPTPFAQPLYRTKLDATSSIITIQPGTSEIVDFYLTEERYVSGGKMVVKNAEFGDYVTAEVNDKDGVIPAPYRAALCESHPTIAKYVSKMWIFPNSDNEIDTRPLNAKITAGLYLRVTYFASSDGIARKLGINYNLTKKL